MADVNPTISICKWINKHSNKKTTIVRLDFKKKQNLTVYRDALQETQ